MKLPLDLPEKLILTTRETIACDGVIILTWDSCLSAWVGSTTVVHFSFGCLEP